MPSGSRLSRAKNRYNNLVQSDPSGGDKNFSEEQFINGISFNVKVNMKYESVFSDKH